MHHLIVLVIPVLMLVDYFLTIVGARLRDCGYSAHFKFADYEMNPLFRKTVAAKRWLSLKHLAMVAVITMLCVFWTYNWDDFDPFNEFFFGGALIIQTMIIGFHASNILTFNFIRRFPAEVQGEVALSHRYVMSITRHRTIGVVMVIVVAAVISRSPYLVGGAVGTALMVLTQAMWLWRDQRAKRRLQSAAQAS